MQPIKYDILLVEDDPSSIKLVETYLNEAQSKHNFKLSTTDRLTDAVNLLKSQTFDIVLLDLGLLDSFGLDTFKKFHKEAPDVPVIVLTSLNDEEAGIDAIALGAEDYLNKSRLNSAVLTHAIRYTMERVNARKKLDSLREEFMHIFTHDLKNPISTIMGYAELIADPEDGALSDKKIEYANNIIRSGKLMLDTITNVVNSSKTNQIQP